MKIPKKKRKKEMQIPRCHAQISGLGAGVSTVADCPEETGSEQTRGQTQIWGDPAPWAGAQGGANLGQDHTHCIPLLRGAR